jgi:diacylglycerol kinase family enzyme
MDISKERYLIIFNTFSGGTKFKNADVTIRRFCDWHGIEYEFLYLEKNSQDIEDYSLTEIQNRFPYTKILIYGGDGTVRRVVRMVYQQDIEVPLGVLPGGSANVYVQFLGLRGSLDSILETFLLSRERSMSVGFMNGHIFILGAFFGTIAQITIEAEKNFKDVLGKWAYVLAGLKYSMNFPPTSFHYTLDNQKKQFLEGHSTFVLLSSVAQKYITFFPEVPENHFQFFAVSNKDILQFGDILYRNFILQEKSKHLHSEKAQTLSISGDFGSQVHLDGDMLPQTYRKFTFEVGEKKIRFLC